MTCTYIDNEGFQSLESVCEFALKRALMNEMKISLWKYFPIARNQLRYFLDYWCPINYKYKNIFGIMIAFRSVINSRSEIR